MVEFVTSVESLASQQKAPAWLSALRAEGANQWQNTPWPTRKTERWKYTPLRSLTTQAFQWSDVDALNDIEASLFDIPELDSYTLVFINGAYSAELSDNVVPESVVLFSRANEAQQSIIQNNLGKIVDAKKHQFASLNNALVAEGVLLHVEKNTVLDKPIRIVNVGSGAEHSVLAQLRLLVVLEDNAQATVIEQFTSTSDSKAVFSNTLTEFHLSSGAQLTHYRLNMENENNLHTGGVHANMFANATLNAYLLAQGCELNRVDYQVNHLGPGAHLEMQGVYIPQNKQLVDYHTEIEHCVPHCTSNEVFRGIIADSAKAVFNGRIHIHPDAQKTLAELSNKNLLLSNQAEVDTKPELEIYADDVRCAHGATVSQINEKEMFYLQSRGVSRQEAQVMLSFGFINEVLREFPSLEIQNYLRPKLARVFGRDDSLVSHLLHDDQDD